MTVLRSRCSTIEELCIALSPEEQIGVSHDRRKCHLANYPTLGLLEQTYGANAAARWLVPQLLNLSEYCGCRGKFTKRQLAELACVIAEEFPYLKVSEFMLFFHRFKAGCYGRFYGAVDPMLITNKLRTEFIRERNAALDRLASEDMERRIAEERKNAVTYEEYRRSRGLAVGKPPKAFAAPGDAVEVTR